VLLCAVLYCAALYCAVMCCPVLRGGKMCCAVLLCAVLYCAALYCAVMCCPVLRGGKMCCAVLLCAMLCCAARCSVLCSAVLCCAVVGIFKEGLLIIVAPLPQSGSEHRERRCFGLICDHELAILCCAALCWRGGKREVFWAKGEA
jgi:hypothetical protein